MAYGPLSYHCLTRTYPRIQTRQPYRLPIVRRVALTATIMGGGGGGGTGGTHGVGEGDSRVGSPYRPLFRPRRR